MSTAASLQAITVPQVVIRGKEGDEGYCSEVGEMDLLNQLFDFRNA